jgi:hypothetical protein
MELKLSRGDYEVYCLLGSDTVLSATNQHFEEPSCNHLQGTLISLHGVKSKKTIIFLFLCQFGGFRSGAAEDYVLLEYDTAWMGNWTPTFRGKLLASSPSRLGRYVAWTRQDSITQWPKRRSAISQMMGIIIFCLVCSLQYCTCMLQPIAEKSEILSRVLHVGVQRAKYNCLSALVALGSKSINSVWQRHSSATQGGHHKSVSRHTWHIT